MQLDLEEKQYKFCNSISRKKQQKQKKKHYLIFLHEKFCFLSHQFIFAGPHVSQLICLQEISTFDFSGRDFFEFFNYPRGGLEVSK